MFTDNGDRFVGKAAIWGTRRNDMCWLGSFRQQLHGCFILRYWQLSSYVKWDTSDQQKGYSTHHITYSDCSTTGIWEPWRASQWISASMWGLVFYPRFKPRAAYPLWSRTNDVDVQPSTDDISDVADGHGSRISTTVFGWDRHWWTDDLPWALEILSSVLHNCKDQE